MKGKERETASEGERRGKGLDPLVLRWKGKDLKGEVKLALFADDRTPYTENPQGSTRK